MLASPICHKRDFESWGRVECFSAVRDWIVSLLLVSAGAVEPDEPFLVGGAGVSLISVAYFALLAIGGVYVVDALWR